MVAKGDPNGEVWSRMGPHEEFLKLCALSAGGEITPEERKKLDEHLAGCAECREALKQFETVVDQAVPALAPDLAPETENPSFSQKAAEASFLKRLSEEEDKSRLRSHTEPWLSPHVVRRTHRFRRTFDRYHFWLPLAAGLILCVSLGIVTYRIGKYRGVDVARSEQKSLPPLSLVPQETLEAARHELAGVNAQLAERDKAIGELRREITHESAENTKLKTLQSEQQLAAAATEEDKKQSMLERDQSAQQAAAAHEALVASEKKLQRLERERSEDVIHAAGLEAKMDEVSRALAVQQRMTDELQELLAKDRDIRELMGARDLYITEVHDILTTGETQKAFGRLFYTKGKSLIFYAYDLNGLPGLKATSTFEAWGNRGPDRTQAVKLGMFYQDNAARKRWVMKFNDKKTLDQIDAVFVTIEPGGGSNKPSGMPLMYAYLKVDANHP